MKLESRSILVATAGVFIAIAVATLRWTFWPSSYVSSSGSTGLILAGLLTIAICIGFGASLLPTRRWRVTLQTIAGLLLTTFVVLPINTWWLTSTYRAHTKPIQKLLHKPQEEFLATIHAQPVFQTRTIDKYSYEEMVLPQIRDIPISIFCGSQPPWGTSIPRDKELTFTVWLTKDLEDTGWSNALETIQDGAKMLYDARICPLHHLKMERAEITIAYGLPSSAFIKALEEFSGGPGFILGGCVVGDGKTTMGYRCPECVALYQKWETAERAEMEKTRHEAK